MIGGILFAEPRDRLSHTGRLGCDCRELATYLRNARVLLLRRRGCGRGRVVAAVIADAWRGGRRREPLSPHRSGSGRCALSICLGLQSEQVVSQILDSLFQVRRLLFLPPPVFLLCGRPAMRVARACVMRILRPHTLASANFCPPVCGSRVGRSTLFPTTHRATLYYPRPPSYRCPDQTLTSKT
jgi:hypothetical protein